MDDKLANELIAFADRIQYSTNVSVQPALIRAYSAIRVARIEACTRVKDEHGE